MFALAVVVVSSLVFYLTRPPLDPGGDTAKAPEIQEHVEKSTFLAEVGPCNHLGTRSYLYGDLTTGSAAVIDAAGQAKVILELAAKHALRIEQVLLTHAHLDHIQATPELGDRLGPDLVVRLHPADGMMYSLHGIPLPLWGPLRYQFFARPIASVAAALLTMTRADMPRASWLREGDVIEVGKLRLKTMHIPGHSPGQVAFHDVDNSRIFTGDCLMRGVIGRTDLPQGDAQAMANSLLRLFREVPNSTRVYSGHTDSTTIGLERSRRRLSPSLLEKQAAGKR